MSKYAVVMPAANEEKTIESTIESIMAYDGGNYPQRHEDV